MFPKSCLFVFRPDYYSIPSVDELNSQIDEKGEIWVKDFIVAREGYGQAKFFGRTNVAGLDLDAISKYATATGFSSSNL